MKIILMFWAVLIGLVLIGFTLQWIRWGVIPTIKYKIQEKKLKKLQKRLDKCTVL